MRRILGISAFYHDSAATLLIDGKIVAAAQEERFSRIKHDASFPQQAIAYCLREGGIGVEKLDAIVFYEKPLLKFDRLLETSLAFAPRGMRAFAQALPVWLNQKLFIPREVDRQLGGRFKAPIYFTTHHQAHAASAFFPSPFAEAAILTFDGVGEWATTSWGIGKGNKIQIRQEQRFPHSLGLLYSAFTYYTGFKVNSGEYKVMGLAPYGRPVYYDLITKYLIDIKDDGSFWLDQSYFNYCAGLTMTSKKFDRLFGGAPRVYESALTQREMDLASSIQRVTEEVMLKMARYVHRQTGQRRLCLAGGVALNCVSNGRILNEGPFEEIWIQPAAGDAGGSLGAATFLWYQLLGQERAPDDAKAIASSCLGPSFSAEAVRKHLDAVQAKYQPYDDEATLLDKVAELLDQGRVVGHFHGRMEFGPRALGNRSILGDARNPNMQQIMNQKIKFRESFRPFAPSCLEERAGEYFQLKHNSPYMLLVSQLQEKYRLPVSDDPQLSGQTRRSAPRSRLPAVTHVDDSARVQTVDAERSARFYRLIKAFEKRTGTGVIINTSFNIRGEPIVCTPQEAYRCFMFTDIDALVLENCLCLKEDQPNMPGADAYKQRFKLD